MKKKFTKITSCLLCLAMLLSMAGPALAVLAEDVAAPTVFFEDLLNGEEIIFSPDSDDTVSIEAPAAEEDRLSAAASLPTEDVAANPFEADGEYEIYPTPQSVTYGTGTVTLPATMQVIYGAGIDKYTVARAVEAFEQAGVTLSESATTTQKLSVTIGDTGNNDKYDAYKLTINASGVTVVGKDTDAAFYGLTTVKRILEQVENKTVRTLTVADYADVPFRGFIEGYYGNPWTKDDRVSLMEFGGEVKMNIYFYAPKDDPKHSTKWRDLYTEKELEDLIAPLAEAGNKSKCYFGFALHPFWTYDFDFSTDAGYEADLNKLKAKYEQAMSVGVRQIAVLADDRNEPSVGAANSYVRLLTDLTAWVSSPEMQAKYPGLKTSIPFCPNDYMGNGSSAQLQALKNLPPSVPVIMTGGQIWGHVEHSFLNTYKNNMGKGPFMWVNWPCSDNSKTSLTMGGHGDVLQTDLTQADIDALQGVMVNPMQQSEPSKAGIFQLADYTWNIWNGSDSAQRIADVWEDCFKYVDHNSAIETKASAALRELSKHMIRQNGRVNGSYSKYDESIDLAPTLTAFRTKLNADTLDPSDITAVRAEFDKLNKAAKLYKTDAGNTRILGERDADGYVTNHEQMAPWLDCWVEFTQANLDLLDALALMQNNGDGSKDSDIVDFYLSGQSRLTASQGHKFWYVDYYETAKVGGQHLVPFTNDLLTVVAETAQAILNPTILVEHVVSNRNDVTDLSALRDGSDSTSITFTNPASLSEGDYVGVTYNRPIPINSVNFKLGGSNADGGKNTFGACKLEYTEDGTTWMDIPGTPTIVNNTMNSSWSGSCRVAEIGISGLSLNAQGVRVVSTEDVDDVWIVVREIYINGQSGEVEAEPETAVGQLTGTVIKSSRLEVHAGPESNLTDNDDSTTVWYKETGTNKDASIVGDYIGLDLGRVVNNVGRVRFVVGNGSDDKWTNFKLQYSTDNTTWTDAGTFSSSNNKDVIEADLGGVPARYVRFVNTVQVNKWLYFSELSVWADGASAILYQSDVVKKITNPVGALTDDSAALQAENVSLRPGEFVGISLPRIREITELIADFTPAPGLVLKVGMSEADLTPVPVYSNSGSGSGAARLFAAGDVNTEYSGNARYIRLENESEKNVSFRLNELSVKSKEIEGIHYEPEMSNMGLDGSYGYQDTRENLAFFDGDISTSSILAHNQDEGLYVTYDLGQLRSIKTLAMVLNESEKNYMRHGVLEVSPTGADGSWTTVVTVNNDGVAESEVKEGAKDDPAFQLGVPQQNYGSFVGELGQAVEARYLRIRVTDAGSKFISALEILINSESFNKMEYVRTANDPTFDTDPIEGSADHTPDKMLDGDLTTGFRPNMTGKTSGYLTYRLSDVTSIGQINIVQDTSSLSDATVEIRTADGWQTLDGKLNKGLNQVKIPDDVKDVLELKLTWGNVTPTFYELIVVPRALEAEAGQQIESDPETIPINSYTGADRVFNFDENWKFNLGDASGAESKVYNDAAWSTVNLPHDYSIEGEYTSRGEAESAFLVGGIGWYRKAFTIDPTWENKVVSINFGGVYMNCEVYLNGIKLGEHHFGYTPFSFVLPSDLLKYDRENVIAVKTDDAYPSSRWYSGAGIYRSTHLTVTDPVHVAKYGTKVETTNDGAVTVRTTVENNGAQAADVTLLQEIYELDGATFAKKGTAVTSTTSAATSVAAGATADVNQSLTVTGPNLWNSWDRGTPNLYVLVTTVKSGTTILDTYETEFGFRKINFDVNTGFSLNGVNTKLKGVCMHHDQGALGAEAWYRALERQVDILMSMGCNAIRVSHNPAADELIAICNRKGMLVLDEAFDTWAIIKNYNNNDFSNWFNVAADDALVGKQPGDTWAKLVLRTMMSRDMNAPCVIMYSLGNELYEGNYSGGSTASYGDIAETLVDLAQTIDTTRPLTYGQNAAGNGNSKSQIAPEVHAAGGLLGVNYRQGWNIAELHKEGYLVYASETVSHTNTRGIYDRKNSNSDGGKGDRLLTAYDKSAVGWGHTASDGWYDTIIRDYSAGEFIWTGFDYLGEPTPWNGPQSQSMDESTPKSSYFGAIDTNGLPKDNYWLYRSMWNEKAHTLHILPTWDRDDLVIENGKVEVVVYTDAPMIKLYLNGTVVGTATATEHTTPAGHKYRTFDNGTGAFVSKTVDTHPTLYATFNVDYKEGTLKAVACDASGNELNWVTQGRSQVKTTTGASKLTAEADRATIKNDGRDLSYVTISITDKDGNIVNGATDAVTVSVSGNGVFMGLDNGVQTDHTSYQSKTRKAGAGQLVAIVQSTETAGSFTLTATAPGLSPASVTVKTAGVTVSTSGDAPVSYELSKTFYVQRGTEPNLPANAQVNLADGSSVTKGITWDAYSKSLLDTAGNEFTITGTIQGYNVAVSVGVLVLDDIVALLNYSTAIQPGTPLDLPASRPGVTPDGTVVNAQFGVEWDLSKVTDAQLTKPGTFHVEGKAEDVFGKEMKVTATVRVANATVTELANVISVAHVQNIAGIEAIRDGSTSTTWTGSGDLLFEYDTAFSLCKVILRYQGSLAAGDVTISTSGNGSEWTTEAVRASVSNGVASFTVPSLASAVFVKINLANQATLSEVELISGSSTFPIGSTAEFDNLKVNGLEVSAAQLAAKFIKTTAENAVITPISDDNVAVTILPENSNSKIIIVTESEDHTARAVYTVQLDAPKDVAATDATNDYDRTKTTATAGSDQGGTVGNAVNGNESSIWHSAYSGSSPEANASDKLAGFPEKRWIQLELQQPTQLVALRYKPRPNNGNSGDVNGNVKDYKVEVSQDGKTWTTVSTGTWSSSADWKIAMFDTTVTAKYVKLWGVNTYGDQKQDNYFMTAAEVRVVEAAADEDDKIDLSAATVSIYKDGVLQENPTFHWKNLDLRPGDPVNSNVDDDVTVTVTLYGNTLQLGVDYYLDYDNNVDPGTAYLYARAFETSTQYQGAAATKFQIERTEDKITSFQPVTLRVYPGAAPELPTEVLATKEDQHRANVAVTWPDVPESFYTYPTGPATTTLTGTIEDLDMLGDKPGQPGVKADLPTLTLKRIDFQSADTVSLATPVGAAPALPSTVTVRFADGTDDQRAVTWDLENVDFSTPGTVTVTGDIQGVDHTGATATVRVVGGTDVTQNTKNIALNTTPGSTVFPLALAYWSSGNNNPYQAIKGQTTGSTAATDRWSDWERDTPHSSTWMGVAFETSTTGVTAAQGQVLTLVPHLVYKAKLMFVDEGSGHAVTYPATYKLQYYTGPVEDLTFDTRQSNEDLATGNGRVRAWTGSPLLEDDKYWKDVTGATYPTVPSTNGQMLEITFDPVNTAILRVLCTAKTEGGNHWVGVQAFEVYDATVTANSDFRAAVTLNGNLVTFAQETIGGKTVNVADRQLPAGTNTIPTLEVTGIEGNPSVSITQASSVPGAAQPGGAWAQAVITSEDGSKTETYIVRFTLEGATSGYSIERDITGANADKVTITPSRGGPAGTQIAVTVRNGYQLTDLWVTIMDGDREGELVKVTDGKFLMPAGNVTFSAGVSPIIYQLKYELNGGSMSANNPRTYTVESNSFTLNNPTRGGYVFAGWVGGGLTSPSTTVLVSKGSVGNRTYIATWSENAAIGGSGGNNNGSGGSGIGAAQGNVTPSGDVVVTETNPVTGATTVTTATQGGLVTAVTTATDGTQTAVIQVPQNSPSSVDAVMPALAVAADKTPVVTIQNNTGRPVSVTVPFTGSDTVVAVRQEKDGTETIIPMSVVDDDGLRLKTQPGDQTIRLVDNKKTFVDVSNSHWAANAVNFVASRELFNGVSASLFAPATPMNRAMITTVLWRLAEKPDASLDALFDDVKPDSYYEEAVAWGVATGVVKGTGNGFEPDAPVTRETLATLLYRAAGSPTVVDELPRRFTDRAQVADWAQTAMIWCVQNDIIRGYSDNTIGARNVATRAEVAIMLQRFVDHQV